MELNKFLEQCNDNDVLAVENKLFKIGHVINAIRTAFLTKVPDTLYECLKNSNVDIQPMRGFRYHSRQTGDSYRQDNTLWFTEGIDAEILEPNFNSWKKGKIRMRVVLEFCPDEPEEKENINNHKIDNNSLDDIRSTISQQ
ncbi:hypothetical protein STA3757_38650 [Stanieria sp. NIES-3757]|nr:hypothetical protein STA3757_38650 [Stanieria sp. NIES-3757]